MSAVGDGRILVVAPGWVGDLVMAQSLFRTLRDRLPDATIDVLAPAWGRALLQRMPEVDGVLPAPGGHGALRPVDLWRTVREARRRDYHWAIVTRRSLKSALVPWLAGVPRRTGVLGESRYLLINDVRAVDGESHPWAVERLAVLGMEAGAHPGLEGVPWPRLVVHPHRGGELEARLGLAGDGPVVGLAPGAAFGPAKQWPLEKFGELAGRLVEAGRRVWVFGGEGEVADGEAVVAAAGPSVRNLCGRTGLDDVVDLMARCAAVVSNDSGLMHVAAATDTRVVALFGSSSPRNTPPLSRNTRVFWLELPCSPCFQRTCPLGHLRCLREIAVADVLTAVLAPDDPF